MVRIAFGSAILILVGGISAVPGQAQRTAVYTAEQAIRGKVAERDNVMAAGKGFGACSDCHAESLTGRVGDPDERPAVASLKPGVQREIAKAGGLIPDLVGPKFRARWANRSVKDLSVNFKDRFGLAGLADDVRLTTTDSPNSRRKSDLPPTVRTPGVPRQGRGT